ncbi:MAG TPA: MGMT family protein [Bryobacterales bacterium]|nr:MGMT family protein [Bryobacterales bacterium]
MPAKARPHAGRRTKRATSQNSPSGYFRQVWAVVRRIPAGRVATYGQVAKLAGFPGTARQVVWALRGAPRAAGLPWHRVLGAGGKIRLPGPAGMEQRLRLEAEGVAFAGAGVRLDRHQWRP